MNAIPLGRLSNRPCGVAMATLIPGRKMSSADPDQTPSRSYEGRPKVNFDKKAQISTYKHIIYLKYFNKNLIGFSRNWHGQEVQPENNNKYQK